MAGPFQYLDPRDGYANDPAWIVFDSLHLKRYGFLGVAPGEPAPDWFSPSADLAELSTKTGIDADGLARTLAVWNDNVGHESDPDFGRGSSAYDGYWGDDKATTTSGKTLGPIDTAPYHAVSVSIGAMGTKGGPRTDSDGRSCMSAARRLRVCTRQAMRWPVQPARRTAVPAGRSVPQWCSATARAWQFLREQTQKHPDIGVSRTFCVCSRSPSPEVDRQHPTPQHDEPGVGGHTEP